ncbi:collagen alpha-1(I) chain-like [Trichosurus vulpecula]|uniref:collagen alpha-1(I) chain-like n=1 Tax=Trichosurus vulpecula TaxID=9337 RepID=UPI00186B0EA0|nr:collagen alpha-1(I) chain-like [Trichosurus vulpecula]
MPEVGQDPRGSPGSPTTPPEFKDRGRGVRTDKGKRGAPESRHGARRLAPGARSPPRAPLAVRPRLWPPAEQEARTKEEPGPARDSSPPARPLPRRSRGGRGVTWRLGGGVENSAAPRAPPSRPLGVQVRTSPRAGAGSLALCGPPGRRRRQRRGPHPPAGQAGASAGAAYIRRVGGTRRVAIRRLRAGRGLGSTPAPARTPVPARRGKPGEAAEAADGTRGQEAGARSAVTHGAGPGRADKGGPDWPPWPSHPVPRTCTYESGGAAGHPREGAHGTPPTGRVFEDTRDPTDFSQVDTSQAFITCHLDYCNILLLDLTDPQSLFLTVAKVIFVKHSRPRPGVAEPQPQPPPTLACPAVVVPRPQEGRGHRPPGLGPRSPACLPGSLDRALTLTASSGLGAPGSGPARSGPVRSAARMTSASQPVRRASWCVAAAVVAAAANYAQESAAPSSERISPCQSSPCGPPRGAPWGDRGGGGGGAVLGACAPSPPPPPPPPPPLRCHGYSVSEKDYISCPSACGDRGDRKDSGGFVGNAMHFKRLRKRVRGLRRSQVGARERPERLSVSHPTQLSGLCVAVCPPTRVYTAGVRGSGRRGPPAPALITSGPEQETTLPQTQSGREGGKGAQLHRTLGSPRTAEPPDPRAQIPPRPGPRAGAATAGELTVGAARDLKRLRGTGTGTGTRTRARARALGSPGSPGRAPRVPGRRGPPPTASATAAANRHRAGAGLAGQRGGELQELR